MFSLEVRFHCFDLKERAGAALKRAKEMVDRRDSLAHAKHDIGCLHSRKLDSEIHENPKKPTLTRTVKNSLWQAWLGAAGMASILRADARFGNFEGQFYTVHIDPIVDRCKSSRVVENRRRCSCWTLFSAPKKQALFDSSPPDPAQAARCIGFTQAVYISVMACNCNRATRQQESGLRPVLFEVLHTLLEVFFKR